MLGISHNKTHFPDLQLVWWSVHLVILLPMSYIGHQTKHCQKPPAMHHLFISAFMTALRVICSNTYTAEWDKPDVWEMVPILRLGLNFKLSALSSSLIGYGLLSHYMIGNFYFLTLPVKVHVDPSLIWWLANQNVVGTMSDTWHVHSRWVAKMMYTINCQSLRVGKCNKIVQRNIRQMMTRGGKRTQCPWWSNLVLESFCACKISKLTCYNCTSLYCAPFMLCHLKSPFIFLFMSFLYILQVSFFTKYKLLFSLKSHCPQNLSFEHSLHFQYHLIQCSNYKGWVTLPSILI